MAKIIITRKKSVMGSAQSHDVYVLNDKVGTLKNGGVLEKEVDVGIHMLTFQPLNRYGKSSSFQAVVNEPDEIVNLDVKFGANDGGSLNIKYADNAPHIPTVGVQNSQNTSSTMPQQFNNAGMCCPKCRSHNLQIISDVKGKGASFTKICLCGICGLAGTGKTTTTHYWICQNCGNKFKA